MYYYNSKIYRVPYYCLFHCKPLTYGYFFKEDFYVDLIYKKSAFFFEYKLPTFVFKLEIVTIK